jgi:hypothetical protein
MKEVRRFEQRRSRLNSFLFVCSSSLRALIGRLDNKSCVYELVLPQSNFRKQEKKFVGIVGRRFCYLHTCTKKKRRETATGHFLNFGYAWGYPKISFR